MKKTKKLLLNKFFIVGLMLTLVVNMVTLTGAWFTDTSCTSGVVHFGGLEFSVEPTVVESGLNLDRIMPGDTFDLELSYAVTGDDAWIRIMVGAFIETEPDFECLLVEIDDLEVSSYLIASDIPGIFYLNTPVLKDEVQFANFHITFRGDLYWNEYQYSTVNYFVRVDAVQRSNIPTLPEALPVFDQIYLP